MRLARSITLSLLLGAGALPTATPPADAQIVLIVGVPPPPLPVYVQPVIPAPDYIWTPGYWAYDGLGGYFWVPGTWVLAPRPGLLWTPGYWAFAESRYVYRPGYWGREVGFYGGVDYGYGYNGAGYGGGYWTGDRFFYNRTVNNITGVTIANVYSQPVVAVQASRVSFNGGQGGLSARPTPQQQAFAGEQHVPPTSVQQQHIQTASRDTSLRESQNHGRPPVAATSRPNDFKGPGVVPAQTAGTRPAGQAIPTGGQPGGAAHSLPVPGAPRPAAGAHAATPNAPRQGQPGTAGRTDTDTIRAAPAQRASTRQEAPRQAHREAPVQRKAAPVRQDARPEAERPQPHAAPGPQPVQQRQMQPPRAPGGQPRPQGGGQPHPQAGGGGHPPHEPGRP